MRSQEGVLGARQAKRAYVGMCGQQMFVATMPNMSWSRCCERLMHGVEPKNSRLSHSRAI
jgi:hypothetical protein